ncbi:hypothetical protein BpHYR1_035645 [Brachionus plicatilis]|uniref:Uncharacterized protein n=1 Tax=Brachionus plicatilis TaxID=10195 RepID=A0A3M7RPU8_BRAPC|nr:hypothetical protein BpHYR1_035645 [Brachionus plicatilis]
MESSNLQLVTKLNKGLGEPIVHKTRELLPLENE